MKPTPRKNWAAVRAAAQEYLKNLPPDKMPLGRKRHILNVSRLAKILAARHGEDPQLAELAGLLHDVARCLKTEKIAQRARATGADKIKFPDLIWTLRHEPLLLHGPVGVLMAAEEFNFYHPKVASAINKHSIAARQMSTLDKILYVADFASFDRRYPQAREARKIAGTHLDRAFIYALRHKILWCISGHRLVHPTTIDTWNYWIQKWHQPLI